MRGFCFYVGHNMETKAVILAAGKGTRMRSSLPKVLHPIGGQSMLGRVIDTARAVCGSAPVVVYGHAGERLRAQFAKEPIDWAEQREQLGTGHAVMQAVPYLNDNARVLILYGDVPLLRAETLRDLLDATPSDGAAILTTLLEDPTGYGRVMRGSDDTIAAIIEHKDADAATRAIREVNTGIMLLPAAALKGWLANLSNDNAQGEYYLTDVVAIGRADGIPFRSVVVADPGEVAGVNDRVQQAAIERLYQRRCAEALMRGGVTLADPERIEIRGVLECGEDVFIDVGCVFEGHVRLAAGVCIGPNCVIKDAEIGPGTHVEAMVCVDGAKVGPDAHVGPFARVRPGCNLAPGVRLGNFVEVKNAQIGEGSKVNHLSYVGDTVMGAHVNVGAGTITCNYDGAYKHQTIIGDGVFIGSDTQLVAPVTVGAGATIAAGTTVTKDVPAGGLTIGRTRQHHLSAWRRPAKTNIKTNTEA